MYQGRSGCARRAALSCRFCTDQHDADSRDDDEKYANPENLPTQTLNLERDIQPEVKAHHVVRFMRFTLGASGWSRWYRGESSLPARKNYEFDVVDQSDNHAKKLPEADEPMDETYLEKRKHLDIPAVDGLVIAVMMIRIMAASRLWPGIMRRASFCVQMAGWGREYQLKSTNGRMPGVYVSQLPCFEPGAN